ncbi:hypothetical protein U1Q18_029373 [Sarracenia purpurea var. burkii]
MFVVSRGPRGFLVRICGSRCRLQTSSFGVSGSSSAFDSGSSFIIFGRRLTTLVALSSFGSSICFDLHLSGSALLVRDCRGCRLDFYFVVVVTDWIIAIYLGSLGFG